MQSKKKMFWNILFLIVVFSLTMYFVFRGKDLSAIVETAAAADKRYLFLAVFCLVLFILGESAVIYYMMRKLGARVKMTHCALYSFVGFFFSCITPSATGGQPAQIHYMRKDKLPVPVTTLVLMIVTITYKAVLVLIGLLVMLFGREFLKGYLGDLMWVFYLGVGLNVFSVTFMMIVVFAPGLAKSFMIWGSGLLERLHLLKKNPKRLEKLESGMDLYHDTAAFWAENRLAIFNVLMITIVQRFFHFTITYWVYRAMGFQEYDFFTITILQSVISVSVDMLPLPGGMGISEKLYLTMFEPVFGKFLLPSMLLSRGISYYVEIMLSAVMTCVCHLVIRGNGEAQHHHILNKLKNRKRN